MCKKAGADLVRTITSVYPERESEARSGFFFSARVAKRKIITCGTQGTLSGLNPLISNPSFLR